VAILVVSDASPLRALHHLNLLHLCPELYGHVIIPQAVEQELRKPTTTCPAIEITGHQGFEIRKAAARASGIPTDLDPGETQAIALAIEIHADLVLIDERKATEAARQLGLTTIGVFGILLEAKRRGLIGQILPLVDRLITDLRFFVSASLRRRLVELADE
jgi:predicted nucleic acid-binding protein